MLLCVNPKGVASKAQGWRFAYPGKVSKLISNPKGVAASLMGEHSKKRSNSEHFLPDIMGDNPYLEFA
jgi:hypothetical protein